MNISSLIVGERKSEQVLNLELVVEGDTAEQRRQWTVQRIRLSPQEKHLAATVKSRHCTEPRWKFDHRKKTQKHSVLSSLFCGNTFLSSQMFLLTGASL